jgi:hypothetical protein
MRSFFLVGMSLALAIPEDIVGQSYVVIMGWVVIDEGDVRGRGGEPSCIYDA